MARKNQDNFGLEEEKDHLEHLCKPSFLVFVCYKMNSLEENLLSIDT